MVNAGNTHFTLSIDEVKDVVVKVVGFPND